MKRLFRQMKNEKLSLFLLLIQLIIFSVFCFYLAQNVKIGISPDELHHFHVSQAYSKTISIPENTPSTYKYGDITTGPSLYYWTNGRILNLNFFGGDELILLRVVSIFYSLLTLIGVYFISKEVINKRIYNIIPPVLLANTLMFTFLSSMVNYDNLVNLVAVFSILIIIRIIKSGLDIKKFSWWAILVALGSLIKVSFLPLALIEFIVIVVQFLRRKPRVTIRKQGIPIICLAGLFCIAAIFLHGRNYLQYGTLLPKCNQILTVEQCMENANFARDYGQGRNLDFKSIEGVLQIVKKDVSPLEYFPEWVFITARSVHGILAHSNLFFPSYFYSIFVLWSAIFIFLFIRKWRKGNHVEMALMIILLFYILFLAFTQNYITFLKRGIHLALQGRYIFPVISIYYVLLVKYYSLISSKVLRYLLFALLLLSFLLGGIPLFLRNVPESWFV